eukprot:scaffold98382_cov34-Phaeocystis_antarctica.AAC.1
MHAHAHAHARLGQLEAAIGGVLLAVDDLERAPRCPLSDIARVQPALSVDGLGGLIIQHEVTLVSREG